MLASLNSEGNGALLVPSLCGGIEYNDNIDQTVTATFGYSTALSGGLTSKNLDGDIYWEAAANLARRTFTNSAYGLIDQFEYNLVANYDPSEHMNLGVGALVTQYSDSAIGSNSYHSLNLLPHITYKLSSDTAVNLNIGRLKLEFPSTGEAVLRQKLGAALFHNFGDNISVNLAGSYSASDSNVNGNDFTSSALQAGTCLHLSSNASLIINYARESISYPNWVLMRSDIKNILLAEYKQKLADPFDLSLVFTSISNLSTDPNYSYNNNSISAGVAWKPFFGDLYGEGIETEAGYFFEQGLVAADQQDWIKAEKYFRKVVFLAEGSDDAHFQLGLALSKQNKFGESRPEFEKAISLNPDKTEAYYLLSYNLIRLGEKGTAVTILQKLYQMTGDNKVKQLLETILN